MSLQLGQVFSMNFNSNNDKELLQSQFIFEQLFELDKDTRRNFGT